MSNKPSVRAARRTLIAAGAAVLTALGAGAVSASAAGTAGAPAAAPRVPDCATSQLTVWLGVPGDAAAGTFYYELEFSNTGHTACRLFGCAA